MIQVDNSTAYTVAFWYLTSRMLGIMSMTMRAIADMTDTWRGGLLRLYYGTARANCPIDQTFGFILACDISENLLSL